ncbi:MAG: methyltransferase domain-containing protein [Sulfurimonadaceae bacterium]
MKISTEFSKYAVQYGTYNIIQNQVAAKLLQKVTSEPRRILDLGCGEGALCKKITWEYERFVGVDFAANMLSLHPKAENIELLYGDFNDDTLFEKLGMYDFDMILSSSAMQWSDDLDALFAKLHAMQTPFALSLFTANTFKTLHATAGIEPLLRSSDQVAALCEKYFKVDAEIVDYRLSFESVRQMFRYIKKSGVSGSRKVLGFKETKRLMEEYPLDYLEFEVLFLTSR